MSKNYYEILGVQKTASTDDIKKAFRRLAHEHHPDKGGKEQRFKDVNEAYQVLGDEKKRATYDQFGSAAFEQGGGGGPGGFDFSGFQQGFGGGFNVNMEDFGDLGDVLGQMFGFGGGRSSSRAKPRGQDIAVDIELSFREAVFGLKKELTLVKADACEACEGNGAEKGKGLKTCETCKGAGQVRQAQRTLFGTMQVAVACSTCEGRGKVPEVACKTCKGSGLHRRESRISLDIPAAVSNGDTLRVTGKGEGASHGGTPGDLYARIRVKTDAHFTRDGFTIHSMVHVPYSILVLGGSMKVETLDGTTEVSIKERTPVGTTLTLRNHGVPTGTRSRGDHLVVLQADVPKKLTREQEHAVEALRKVGL